MTISAQVAIYPLRQQRLTPAIDALTDALKAHGLAAECQIVNGQGKTLPALGSGHGSATINARQNGVNLPTALSVAVGVGPQL